MGLTFCGETTANELQYQSMYYRHIMGPNILCIQRKYLSVGGLRL